MYILNGKTPNGLIDKEIDHYYSDVDASADTILRDQENGATDHQEIATEYGGDNNSSFGPINDNKLITEWPSESSPFTNDPNLEPSFTLKTTFATLIIVPFVLIMIVMIIIWAYFYLQKNKILFAYEQRDGITKKSVSYSSSVSSAHKGPDIFDPLRQRAVDSTDKLPKNEATLKAAAAAATTKLLDNHLKKASIDQDSGQLPALVATTKDTQTLPALEPAPAPAPASAPVETGSSQPQQVVASAQLPSTAKTNKTIEAATATLNKEASTKTGIPEDKLEVVKEVVTASKGTSIEGSMTAAKSKKSEKSNSPRLSSQAGAQIKGPDQQNSISRSSKKIATSNKIST